ncbi:hypothetical protein AKO1_014349 [Acrasis kona]|uniref:DUF4042 domain-containing protein n=1 Tax=Acrasis kona TaxID=1008807 RepID=A0AAW2Z1I8_9EUKA
MANYNSERPVRKRSNSIGSGNARGNRGGKYRGRGRGQNVNGGPMKSIPEQWKNLGDLMCMDERQVEHVLDSLNSVTYPNDSLDEQMCTCAITKLCSNRMIKQDLIASKLTQLMTTLCAKQQISTDQCMNESFTFLMELIPRAHSWLLSDSLRALSYIVSQGSSSILSTDQFKQAIDAIMPSLDLTVSDLEVRRQSVNTVASLCLNVQGDKKYTKLVQSLFVPCLRSFNIWTKSLLSDSSLSKNVKSVLRAMTAVVSSSDRVHVQYVEDIISKLLPLCFYGTKMIPAIPHNKANISKSDDVFTSDSDMSDNDATGLAREAMHIRAQSLQLIGAMAHRDFKSLFAQWANLFPSQDALSQKLPHLTSCLLFDTSARCRSVAATTISATLERSKVFLVQADDTRSKKSFTPFSQTLASTLIQIHSSLLYSIKHETSAPTQCNVLRCLSVLVDQCPYGKLESLDPYLIDMMNMLKQCLLSTDSTVCQCSLQCASVAFGSVNCMGVIGSDVEWWLEEMIKRNFNSGVANVSKNYKDVILDKWEQVKNLIQQGLSDHDYVIKSAVLQILVSLTNCAQIEQVPENEGIPEQGTQLTQAQQNLNKKLSRTMMHYNQRNIPVEVWEWILSIIPLSDSSNVVRVTGCAVLANIPDDLLQQSLVDDLVRIARNDTMISVRLQAYRTLGQIAIGCKHEAIKIPVTTLSECISKESNGNVRMKAAWMIANICESMDYSQDKDMLNLLLSMTKDKKVASSAVRALANMGNKAIPLLEPFVSDEDHKVRWNACYSLGTLRVGCATKSLCEAIQNDDNFKVRIQAVTALNSTNDYGDDLALVWSALLTAFTQPQPSTSWSDHHSDFNKQYKYLRTLKDQLQSTLCHVVIVTNEKELNEMVANVMVDHAETICLILRSVVYQKSGSDDTFDENGIIRKVTHLYNQILERKLVSSDKRPQIEEAVSQILKSMDDTM